MAEFKRKTREPRPFFGGSPTSEGKNRENKRTLHMCVFFGGPPYLKADPKMVHWCEASKPQFDFTVADAKTIDESLGL